MGVCTMTLVVGLMLRMIYKNYGIMKSKKMSDHLPNVVIVLAVSVFFINAGSAYVDLAVTDWRAVYKDQEFFLLAPLLKIILQLISFITVTYFGSMFLDLPPFLVKNFEKGIAERLRTYHSNADHKATIDEMQYHYRCCGGANYKDWLTTRWYLLRYSYYEFDQSMKAKLGKFDVNAVQHVKTILVLVTT
ncbi:hypothetical protein HELRODRAFT_159051 [Helobdella robusta]|uniref:Tetraspanin n=1 Tax=Helobdella robusta TaxID=6412 RepID=T1ENJ1_HELRO|nr:hypothetical protein HELRODRAFT_159051 [Helobdella robusta]ESO12503.1 hypothetical protein HELRODRAFT_159051 [Helobdella robusta]